MKKNIEKITVYCASSSKIPTVYFDAAKEFGKILALNGIDLVYGGGAVGVMGALADSVLAHGGRVYGIIPQFMCDAGWQHNGLTELTIVENMHQRKEMMAQMGDATVALPGGVGTMEEVLEIITWKQLGIYTKPIVFLNLNSHYDHLLAHFQNAANEMFIRPQHLDIWSVANSCTEILPAIFNSETVSENMQKFAKI